MVNITSIKTSSCNRSYALRLGIYVSHYSKMNATLFYLICVKNRNGWAFIQRFLLNVIQLVAPSQRHNSSSRDHLAHSRSLCAFPICLQFRVNHPCSLWWNLTWNFFCNTTRMIGLTVSSFSVKSFSGVSQQCMCSHCTRPTDGEVDNH